MSAPAPPLVSARAGRFRVLTPEHVPLGFRLADPGTRLGAVLIDYFLIFGSLAAGVFALAFVGGLLGEEAGSLSWAVFLVVSFLLRNFYFSWLELRWQGRTLGKRLLGLRVVARDGGPLSPGLVFARNLTRELEIFLPIVAVFAPQTLVPGAPGWVIPFGLLWVLALTLLPFLNRHRARLGDLVAGTVVVAEPRAELLPDLAHHVPVHSPVRPGADEERAETENGGQEGPGAGQAFGKPTLHFSREQLDLYGIRELQILEDVLRRDLTEETEELMQLVCEKIQKKIDWPEERRDEHPAIFLKAFYTAQRARLEHKMMLGRRQEKKVR